MPKLFLNRWNQHVVLLTKECGYRCLGCPIQTPDPVAKDMVSDRVTAIYDGIDTMDVSRMNEHEWVNIVGGDPCTFDQLDLVLQQLKNQRVRCWSNNMRFPVSKEIMDAVNEWVIYAPGVDQDSFFDKTGRDLFDDWVACVKRLKDQSDCVWLSYEAHPLHFYRLPEFYDIVHDTNTYGMIIYHPKDFDKEQQRYLKRFNRVNRMMGQPIPKHMIHSNYCLGVAPQLATAQFEWREWMFLILFSTSLPQS